ncbi:MAG: MBL fold metallo-hydrolase [Planctomycetes bacterium]|nr:MBL fold metallo-hydrolase [Planctomycetota bacterium]
MPGRAKRKTVAKKLRGPVRGPYSFSFEIFPGVHLLALLPEGAELAPMYLGVCAYLIKGGDGRSVLIDSGQPNQTALLVKLLARLKVRPGDIELVACTHAHGDHVGGCAFLQKHGAGIAIHDSAESLPFKADIRFRGGDRLRAGDIELRVLHTPGHTKDSCSFVLNRSDRTILFAGDLAGWYFARGGSDVEQMIKSARKVRGIQSDCVCFGHRIILKDIPVFWERLIGSLERGVFSLVDIANYGSVVARTWEKIMRAGI